MKNDRIRLDIDEETTNFVDVCNYDKHIIDILCCDDRRENSDLPQILEEYRQEMFLKRGNQLPQILRSEKMGRMQYINL